MSVSAVTMFSGITKRRAEEALVENSDRPFTEAENEAWAKAEEKFVSLNFMMRIHGYECGRDTGDILRNACLHNFDAVMVDHLGMIGRDSNGREFDMLSESIHALRGLSRGEIRKDRTPWVVATTQLNREIDKGESERPPRMSDFRGSARIEHDADVAIGLVKRRASENEEDPISHLDGFVVKNRNGPPDAVLLWEANGATGLITERRKEDHQPTINDPDDESDSERYP
jgi:hypothetical protein